ncbi:hypothetical protein EJB05_00626, partial [Eragrostis curvula]
MRVASRLWSKSGEDRVGSRSLAIPLAIPSGSWAWDRPRRRWCPSGGLKCGAGVIGPALVSLDSLPASLFFVGCLAGGFLLTTLADSLLGRKKIPLVSLASMSAAGAAFAFGFGRSIVGT